MRTPASETGKATAANADTYAAAGGATNTEHVIHPPPDPPTSRKEPVKDNCRTPTGASLFLRPLPTFSGTRAAEERRIASPAAVRPSHDTEDVGAEPIELSLPDPRDRRRAPRRRPAAGPRAPGAPRPAGCRTPAGSARGRVRPATAAGARAEAPPPPSPATAGSRGIGAAARPPVRTTAGRTQRITGGSRRPNPPHRPARTRPRPDRPGAPRRPVATLAEREGQ